MIIFDFAGTLVEMRPPQLLVRRGLLRRLSRRYQLAILTGGNRKEVINILKKLTIKNYFDEAFIVTKSDTGLRKPDPRLLKSLLSLGKTNKAVYIGDKIKDYRMAAALGVKFIYVGKRKLGNIQLRYDITLVEGAINKLLSSERKQ